MCQNCTTLQALKVMSAEMPDGGVVTIAHLATNAVNLESQQTGAMYTPPPCEILLLLSPGPETLCFSVDQWMEAFLALQFVMVTLDSEPGSAILKKWADFSPAPQKK